MASINDRRQLGEEIAIRVRTTVAGVKVIVYDGSGLAEGIMTKDNRRYFYGDDAEEQATAFAYRLQERLEDQRECPVTVVELGEVMAEKLADVQAARNGGDEA